jgi:small subunit ribosomal protein S13
MARLIGVDLPREKRVEIGLTYIFGVGRTRAKQGPRRHRHQPGHPGQGPDRRDLVALRDFIETNSRSKVTSAVRSPPISDARSRSAATREFVTVVASRSAVSAPRPTRAPVRVKKRTVAGKKKAGKCVDPDGSLETLRPPYLRT